MYLIYFSRNESNSCLLFFLLICVVVSVFPRNCFLFVEWSLFIYLLYHLADIPSPTYQFVPSILSIINSHSIRYPSISTIPFYLPLGWYIYPYQFLPLLLPSILPLNYYYISLITHISSPIDTHSHFCLYCLYSYLPFQQQTKLLSSIINSLFPSNIFLPLLLLLLPSRRLTGCCWPLQVSLYIACCSRARQAQAAMTCTLLGSQTWNQRTLKAYWSELMKPLFY